MTELENKVERTKMITVPFHGVVVSSSSTTSQFSSSKVTDSPCRLVCFRLTEPFAVACVTLVSIGILTSFVGVTS